MACNLNSKYDVHLSNPNDPIIEFFLVPCCKNADPFSQVYRFFRDFKHIWQISANLKPQKLQVNSNDFNWKKVSVITRYFQTRTKVQKKKVLFLVQIFSLKIYIEMYDWCCFESLKWYCEFKASRKIVIWFWNKLKGLPSFLNKLQNNALLLKPSYNWPFYCVEYKS